MKQIFLFFILGTLFLSSLVFAQDFSLDKTEISLDVLTSSIGTQKIVVTNLLNQTVNITINTASEARKFIFFDENMSIPANSTEEFVFGYFISPITPPQSYKYNLTFISANQTSTFNIVLNVKDYISPIIERCEISPPIQNRTKSVAIICSGIYDLQSNISLVKAIVSKENFSEIITFTKVLKDEYKANFTSKEVGIYNTSITAWDGSNNSINYSIPLQFVLTEWSPLTISDIDFSKVRYGQSHQRAIASLSEPATLSVEIRNFDYVGNVSGNLTLMLRLPDRSIQLKSDFQKLENVPKGDISAELFSDVMGRVNGEIVFFIDKEQTSRFTANFTWYTVPPSFQTAWYNNPVFCWSEDYGSYYNASRKCTITMPIDTNIGDSMALVPISIGSINFTRLTENERMLTSRVSIYKTLVYVLSILSVLAIGGAVAYYIHESW